VIICYIPYLLLVLIARGRYSLMISILTLELLSWLFVFLLPNILSLKYLFIQRYFLVLAIISIFWLPLLIVFGLFLKLGLPPVHLWYIHFSNLLRRGVFFFIITVHKVYPIFVLAKIFVFNKRIFAKIGLLLIRSLLLFQASLFSLVLICSSIVHRVWMILGLIVSKSFTILYWILYTTFLSILLQSSFIYLSFIVVGQNFLTRRIWLVLSGFPPFALFWLKFRFFIIIVNLRIHYSFLLIISSILALSAYYWAFHIRVLQYSYIFPLWRGVLVRATSCLGLF